ncbi:hypothetical protein Vafri_19523 [Volvox africanus]|uniref:Uncharacterized protein n=1 Tax=Volvox africanus TaxID=51714 RepID=A0A8J4FD04_9CHLO|nr:hypothetical protein Vafri_19523 [Volvox africanus]
MEAAALARFIARMQQTKPTAAIQTAMATFRRFFGGRLPPIQQRALTTRIASAARLYLGLSLVVVIILVVRWTASSWTCSQEGLAKATASKASSAPPSTATNFRLGWHWTAVWLGACWWICCAAGNRLQRGERYGANKAALDPPVVPAAVEGSPETAAAGIPRGIGSPSPRQPLGLPSLNLLAGATLYDVLADLSWQAVNIDNELEALMPDGLGEGSAPNVDAAVAVTATVAAATVAAATVAVATVAATASMVSSSSKYRYGAVGSVGTPSSTPQRVGRRVMRDFKGAKAAASAALRTCQESFGYTARKDVRQATGGDRRRSEAIGAAAARSTATRSTNSVIKSSTSYSGYLTTPSSKAGTSACAKVAIKSNWDVTAAATAAAAAGCTKPHRPQAGGAPTPPRTACRKVNTTLANRDAKSTCSIRRNNGTGNSSNCNSNRNSNRNRNSSEGPNAVTTIVTGASSSWQWSKQTGSGGQPIGNRASPSKTPCCSPRRAWNAATAPDSARMVTPRLTRTKPPAREGAAKAAHSAAAVLAANTRSGIAHPTTPQPQLQQYTSLQLMSLPDYALAGSPEYIDWMHVDIDEELRLCCQVEAGPLWTIAP